MNYSEKKNGKNPEESKAETTIVMLPSDANPKGNVFGGVILKHVDLIAGLVAKRHAGHANVVTASIDKMSFLKPIFIGNAIILSARINYVKRSSMEIEVNIQAEDLDDNTFSMAMTAWSANVWSRAICASEKGRASVRRTPIVPMTVRSRMSGTASVARHPRRRAFSLPSGNSSAAACRSGT